MQNFDSAENQTTNVMEESQMGGEGKEKDETRSSIATKDKRRITTNTSLERHDDDKAAVAVTTQESKEGFREMAMRIASIGELETGSSAETCSSPGGAGNDEVKKAN